MVSQEDKQLRDYELVIIVSPEAEDEAIESVIERVSRFITENSGTVSNIERWGKRRLAYPIKHFMEGSYVLARFKMKPKLSKELEASLGISEEVLRHLLTRLNS
jgi:small subunit ribosomal protein S6